MLKFIGLIAVVFAGMAWFVAQRTARLGHVIEAEIFANAELYNAASTLSIAADKIQIAVGKSFAVDTSAELDLAEDELKSGLNGLESGIRDFSQVMPADTSDIVLRANPEIEGSRDLSLGETVAMIGEISPKVVEMARGALLARREQIDAARDLEEKRKDLNAAYRANMGFRAFGEGFWQPYSRAVLTVLSSSSLKDIAYAGRALFAEAEQKLPPQGKGKFAEVQTLFKATREVATRAMAGSNDFTTLMTLVHDLERPVKAITEYSRGKFKNGQAEALTVARGTRRLVITVSLIAIAAVIALGILFTRRVTRRLAAITKGVTEAGTMVTAVSSELSSASQVVSAGATEAASSLEETVASLEEISSMVRLNAENAAKAAELSHQCYAVAERSDKDVNGLIASMNEISSGSKKIEEIVNVIDDIAFQTNLLALNAAVEAARAGEQGKGFAVVAEAVRGLAQRSSGAAHEIGALIKENVGKINVGTREADKSSASLQQVLTAVMTMNKLSNDIAKASAEQSHGISQVSKAMHELDVATQRNAASSEQVAASSDEMSQQSENLSRVVSDLSEIIEGSVKETKAA